MEHHSLTAAWALPPHYHHQKEYCPIHCDVKSYYLSCYKSNCSFAPVELCCFDIGINSVQSLSCVRLFATPWTAAHQGSLIHYQLLEPTQTHVHRVGDAIQPSQPLSSPSPPAFNLSQHQDLFQ